MAKYINRYKDEFTFTLNDAFKLSPEFDGLMISGFHKSDNGYTITTYGQFDHLQDTEIIGGII